jgi:hypothetical protein
VDAKSLLKFLGSYTIAQTTIACTFYPSIGSLLPSQCRSCLPFLPELCQEHGLIPRKNRCLCGSLRDILRLHWRSSISRGDSNLLHSVSRSRGVNLFSFLFVHAILCSSKAIAFVLFQVVAVSVIWSFLYYKNGDNLIYIY